MKSLLIAAALLAAPALAPDLARAQVAAATLPNTLDRPVAQTQPGAAQAPAPAPSAPANVKAEETLRAIVAGAQSGHIDYALMTDDLAGKVREQEAQLAPLIQQFGALQSVRHVGVESGADLFRVDFANQATQWIIGFNADGKVAALLFRPAT